MDNELHIIIKLLTNKPFVSVKELEIESKATRRQINYRLEKINQLLIDKDVSPLVIGSTKEIILTPSAKKVLVEYLRHFDVVKSYYLSKRERLSYMYLMLFMNSDYLTLQHFMDYLNVSRSTILSDFKELVQELNENGIDVRNNRTKGYYLKGSELQMRRFMMRSIIFSLANEQNTKVFDLFIEDYHLDIFNYSKLVISELALKHRIVFVEDRLIEFIYIFIFLKARMLSGKDAKDEISQLPDIAMMRSMKEYIFTEELLLNYKNTDQIQPFEIYYISSWILGISVGNVEEDSQDCLVISEIVGKIMERFENLSGVHYMDDEEIFRQLFSHCRPAYYRLLFKIPIYNPLCKKVKKEYNKLYLLIEETMKPFDALFGQAVPQDELAYLTIHFATIYSNHREYELLPKKSALIVCSNGIGSSAILYNELTVLFPELHFLFPIESAKIKDVKEPFDIVFITNFTMDCEWLDVPIIKVSPIMSIHERYQVVREVYMRLGETFLKQPSIDTVMTIIKKHVQVDSLQELERELLQYFSQINQKPKDIQHDLRLSDIVDETITLLDVDASDWESAIRLSAKPMVLEGYIEQRYVDEIIRISKISGAFVVITKHVALPHTKPHSGAIKCGIGIARLKNPIEFGSTDNDPVKYVFCLSARDNEQHLNAIAELVELLNDDMFYHIIDHAKHPKYIIQFIKNYEK